MLRGFRWLALGVLVVTAALVGPSIALADNCGSSATSIYVEKCSVPNASGKHHHSGAVNPTTGTTSSTTPYVQPQNGHPTTKPGNGKPAQQHPANRNTAPHNRAQDPPAAQPHFTRLAAPRAAGLGSTFDLGAGPTILLVLLLGSVLAVLGAGFVRAWRNRDHV
jgi:hypothetical protein